MKNLQVLKKEIHDSKSLREFIREFDKMKLDYCIREIVAIVNTIEGEKLLHVAINEFKNINSELLADSPQNIIIKDLATRGIIVLMKLESSRLELEIIKLKIIKYENIIRGLEIQKQRLAS